MTHATAHLILTAFFLVGAIVVGIRCQRTIDHEITELENFLKRRDS